MHTSICKHLYLLPRLVLTQSSVKHRNGKKHQQCSKKITSFLTRKKIADINFNDLCCHLAKCLLTVTLRQYSGTRHRGVLCDVFLHTRFNVAHEFELIFEVISRYEFGG
jgi:hypothetical protein